MEQLIKAEIIKIRESRKRPCAETIWSQLSKNGHQYEFMMEHSGLIANRPHKGEDSFFVTSNKTSPDLTAERHPRGDNNESDTTIFTKDSVSLSTGKVRKNALVGYEDSTLCKLSRNLFH